MTDGRREPAAWGRPLDRRAFLGVAGVGGAALIAAACGGGGSSSNGGTPQAPGNATAVPRGPLTTVPSSPSAITPAILTQDFVAKQDNRFAVGLLDAKQALVKGAAVHLRFFTVDAGGETGTFRGEGDAQFVELGIEDEHAYDASPPGTSGTSVAFYVVNTPFDAPGKWAVEIQVTLDGSSTPTTIQTAF
ncbi:MAG: hypothetical protein HYX52_03870, partial [Chloroflexi bacterium]|nr:hypothetical protein [Chloroflexota bacterium]